MIRTITLCVTMAVLVSIAFQVQAQIEGDDYPWRLKRDKEAIQIFTSKVKGSRFKAARGVMEVDSSINQLVALVEDLSACSDWIHLCKSASTIERISDTEIMAYIVYNTPFPVKKRDVYARTTWSIDESTGTVSMISRASEGGPPKGKPVRILNAVSQWHFTPLNNGKIKVENFAHIDPNGPIPAWITNLLLVDTPYKTMKAMREIVETDAYKDAEVSFLN